MNLIGTTISHYQILEKLGTGGMGVVYKARDTKLGRFVALKFLPPHLSQAEEEKKRFIHEAKAASALDHPNICNIYEIDETEDGQMFIAMACYEGESLKEKIDRGPLPIDEAVGIAIQIAEGLAQAHSKEIVHRDIKPANVLLTESGQAKVVDFGLAKLAGRTMLTKEGTTLGTVAYMSPEQAQGKDIDHKTDIWALGVILYEMLAGKHPFKGDYEQAVIYSIRHDDPDPVGALRQDVPEALARIVHHALERDPQVRYASCADMLIDLRPLRDGVPLQTALSLSELLRQPRFAIPIVVLILLIAGSAFFWMKRSAKAEWARQELLPQIERLAQDIDWTGEGPNSWRAYKLILRAEQYISDDPLLKRLEKQVSRQVKIYSDPTAAQIYIRPYAHVDSAWFHIGETSSDSFRLPVGFSGMKLEKKGYQSVHDIAWVSNVVIDTLRFTLPEKGSLPEEMVLLPNASNWYDINAVPASVHLPGLEGIAREQIGDFLMDQYEVTNKDYKRFVESGGYKKPEYWKHPFVKGGRTISWEEAMTLLRDKTNKSGPATWEVGDYPNGQDDYPVNGVSWYEAAAYAEFAGKSLPTIYHWDRAAFVYGSPAISALSNISGNEGPIPVGLSQSMNRFGVFDLSGNVREWCFNESSSGGRFLMGGGWDDPKYGFFDAHAQHPFNRAETNGFRCITYIDAKQNRQNLEKMIPLAFRDFYSEKPVSDEMFAIYKNQFAYDKTELNAVVKPREENEDWKMEKITFDAAYGSEPMSAFLFLPKRGTPPYQTVIYFPGSYAVFARSSSQLVDNMQLANNEMFLKSGRAFLYPIYKCTYERFGEDDTVILGGPTEKVLNTVFWKERVIMWGKDLSRSIDYLETRDDIDKDKLAYYGFSWGGTMGGIYLAIEDRIKTGVLYVTGLLFPRTPPEVEMVHYLPRVKMPVLMINGEHDFFRPFETSQLPFYQLLGTPEKDKRLFAFEGGHTVPRPILIEEALGWLDKYLGPVE